MIRRVGKTIGPMNLPRNHDGRRPFPVEIGTPVSGQSNYNPGSGPGTGTLERIQDWVDHYYRQAATRPNTNDQADFFVGAAGQGGWFDDLSESDQAAIQFNIPVGVDLTENIRISEALRALLAYQSLLGKCLLNPSLTYLSLLYPSLLHTALGSIGYVHMASGTTRGYRMTTRCFRTSAISTSV